MIAKERIRCCFVFSSKRRCSNTALCGRLCVTHTRDEVAARLARAEAADPGSDPIEHRLDEYRACIAELDAWIAELDDEMGKR
jgi:hypothetical protein